MTQLGTDQGTAVAPAGTLRVGVDIGGTKTDAVAVLADGSVGSQLRLPTGFGPQAVVETAVTAVTRLAELAGTSIDQFRSIGIGIPGTVDGTGRVSHAVNLGLDGLDLGRRLSDRLGRDVRIDNDVNAAALGAFHVRSASPVRSGGPAMHSMAYLNLGTGLAAGLVLDGALWRGSRGAAGEIGHIPIDPVGPECLCGQRGCLEMVASGSAIERQWPTDDPKPARALFSAAASGDASAVLVRDRFVENVAAAVRILVLTVDVDSVVIGGGLSSIGEPLIDAVREVLVRWEAASPFLASAELSRRVSIVPPGFPAAAVGAALVGAG
jgi:glucokinase